MRRSRRNQGADDADVDMTPMLDIVFIMLIFFIVTATFVKEEGLDVNQPDDDKPKTVDPDKKSIVVRITSRDRIQIAQRDVDWRAVRRHVAVELRGERTRGMTVVDVRDDEPVPPDEPKQVANASVVVDVDGDAFRAAFVAAVLGDDART